jgi:arginyl-tRNA synthetase
MVLAKPAGTNPRTLAALLVPRLAPVAGVAQVEVAGPGFLNVRLDPEMWREEMRTILAQGPDYGRSTMGAGTRVNVEYVSANPTGPMHMGHCRGAVVGDALATLLEYAGFAVTANIMSTMPGRRSRRSAARSTCATARRWGRRSPSPRGSTPATI